MTGQQATISCPHCDGTSEATMPQDACLRFYDCPHCGALLQPRPGDCCVFCSYSDHVCPPREQAGSPD